jgi:hypothetical protein
MEEPEGPGFPPKYMTTKTTKRRWGIVLYSQGLHHASTQGFQTTHDQQKYDGSQEPQSWLSDYLQAIKILGGTKETAMQSLQLHLTDAARSWLRKLEKGTIGS